MLTIFEASGNLPIANNQDKIVDQYTLFAVPLETQGCDTTFYDCMQELEVSFYT